MSIKIRMLRFTSAVFVAVLVAACTSLAPAPVAQDTRTSAPPVVAVPDDGGSAPADSTEALTAPESTAVPRTQQPAASAAPTVGTAATAGGTGDALAEAPSTDTPVVAASPVPAAATSPTIAVSPRAGTEPSATVVPAATAAAPTASPAAAPTALPADPAVPAAPGSLTDGVSGPVPTPTHTLSTRPNPLQIEVMRQQSYPGSEVTIEQTLAPGANYTRYIASYRSDGLKIYALLTIPNGPKPPTGWPVIIFNHGYIPPAIYRTTERYVAYVDAIARSGYIVFKPDYRGNGSSEGSIEGGGYGSPGYTADVLNALASMKAYKDADPNRLGIWAHSMGGQLALKAMVISKDIKAGVIWGGVVAPYPDMLTKWTRRAPPEYIPPSARHWRADLINEYGTPAQNPGFWASISPNTYVSDLSGPLQLHASTTDEEVPVAFSQTLYKEAQAAGKYSELYTYPGDNHNITANFNRAMARSIAFFDKYVKNAAAPGE